ncbi:MAG: hypothetical protein ACRDUT_00070 [Mycobacterium sp.]
MSPAPLIAGLPPSLDLGAGMTIRVTALDAATGDLVSGVNIDTSVITANDLSGTGGAGASAGPYMLVPGPAN